jgi:hypothetical protein
MFKTKEERAAYVRGVLETCEAFNAASDVVAAVCGGLCITAEELMQFVPKKKEAKRGAADHSVPEVRG